MNERRSLFEQLKRASEALAFGVLLLIAGGCMEPGQATAQAGLDQRTLSVDGVRRQYALYTPKRVAEEGARALVIMFHGGEGSPDKIARQTGFNEVADAQGLLVAYPRSIEHWNDGRATTRSFGDDVAFARALIDTLVADAGVDPQRVYATGASNGGMMTLRLACEANDVIAAFAPVIASFPVPYVEQCRPGRAVDILMINGRSDRLIRWGGGRIPKGRRAGVGGEVIPVPDTVDWWRAHNGCAEPERDSASDRVDDGTSVVRERNAACERGGSVSFFAIEGGGHTWPGSPVRANVLAGRISQEISASQVIWQFFSDKTL